MPRAMRIEVLEMSEMDCQTTLRRTGLFGRVKKTSCFTVCEKKAGVHCSMKSSRLVAAIDREM